MVQVTMQQMLEAGVHFGHQTRRWNPKMKQFIYGARGGIHIIDLEQTAHAFNRALQFVRREVERGKVVLFVSTKQQTKELLPKHAQECGMPYVTERWLGGFLTNFKTISKRIQHLKDLEEEQRTGEVRRKYTKKEALLRSREAVELNRVFSGTKTLDRLPDVLFVVDLVRDAIAVREAKRAGIPVVSLVDTNADPYMVDYPIPANDDGIKSLDLMLGTVAAVIKAHATRQIKPAAQPKPVEVNPAEVTEAVLLEKGDHLIPADGTTAQKDSVKKTPKQRT